MVPKTRLGKRSPLGALVSAACPTLEGLLDRATSPDREVGVACIATATGARAQANGRVKLHPGLKVCFQCESSGVEHHHHNDQPSLSSAPPPSRPHPVSSCIDVPRSSRRPEEVDMDEMMAAMVLTSLSCSPLLHSEPAASGMECVCGELSDSSSGYWSVGHSNGSPAPSPPITEPDAGLATPSDEGLDMELEQVLFDEPAPRKRRQSSGRAAFGCLWPSCGKVLTSVVGIKRHVRTVHLGLGGEQEEDFYYTEIQQRDPPTPPPTPFSPASSSPSSPSSPLESDPPSDGTPRPSPLSRSAPPTPGSLWQVQSEHSYQAVSFRVRSVSVGEQWLQQDSAPSRTLPASAPPPRCHWPARRIRGEAKKCRKVYGIEHRDQWCTACRWKKACQRFLD
ncbi:zinc finger protein 395a [Myripristis murdjan]|uniref:zinc finger protein 395a n=1 Tax=Myripristis murdjan TaxID=586833 RepID=UPI0011763151|nr:zinc finger protein 395-like [Myripristis murdjan]